MVMYYFSASEPIKSEINTYYQVVKELWLRKQTSPSGSALRITSFTP